MTSQLSSDTWRIIAAFADCDSHLALARCCSTTRKLMIIMFPGIEQWLRYNGGGLCGLYEAHACNDKLAFRYGCSKLGVYHMNPDNFAALTKKYTIARIIAVVHKFDYPLLKRGVVDYIQKTAHLPGDFINDLVDPRVPLEYMDIYLAAHKNYLYLKLDDAFHKALKLKYANVVMYVYEKHNNINWLHIQAKTFGYYEYFQSVINKATI